MGDQRYQRLRLSVAQGGGQIYRPGLNAQFFYEGCSIFHTCLEQYSAGFRRDIGAGISQYCTGKTQNQSRQSDCSQWN